VCFDGCVLCFDECAMMSVFWLVCFDECVLMGVFCVLMSVL